VAPGKCAWKAALKLRLEAALKLRLEAR